MTIAMREGCWRWAGASAILLGASLGCSSSADDEPDTERGGTTASAGKSGRGGASGGRGEIWTPAPGTSWQWQLSGELDTSFDVAVYDIDLFGSTQATVDALHAEGRRVICYLDAAYEPGRPDSDRLVPFKGEPMDGWPGQFWLDIREPVVLETMQERIALAASKQCDGIEADDVDVMDNDSGFEITNEDQLEFIRALADSAHAAGLAFGLKNDLAQVEELVDVADFAINEECFQFDECEALTPFIARNKAVFHVEYTEGALSQLAETICPKANALNFDTLIKHLDLDAPRVACR